METFHYLHLSDSSQQIPAGKPDHDKLFKVRGLLDLVLPQLDFAVYPAIDEAMIPYKGRLSFKQYIKLR